MTDYTASDYINMTDYTASNYKYIIISGKNNNCSMAFNPRSRIDKLTIQFLIISTYIILYLARIAQWLSVLEVE